jgi:hypothetical protein
VRVKRLALIVLLCCVSAAMIWAGCKSDCRDEYQSEIESCHLLNDDPDDADDLQICLQDAKDQYDACVEECDN